MRVLIIEAHSGISGDMFVAAATRLAGCEDEVAALPRKLGFTDVTCSFRDVNRASIQSRKFDVMEGSRPAEVAAAGHGHSHVHAHEHAHGHPHEHTHEHVHGHSHDHGHHDHDHHHHGDEHDHHEHRSLSMIREMITAAGLETRVEERALRMFDRLGEVEAAAHGIPVEHVHFHEVGAVDSIIDIVAAALVIERLDVDAAFSTPICVGSGTVNTAHGILPVPAPATERLLQGMPTTTGALTGEWTTPTGALILGELGVGFEMPETVTTASAYGAGGRDPVKRPNILRLRLAEAKAPAKAPAPDGLERDELVEIRCNIDDTTGELLGAEFVDALLQAGARDVVIQPVIMKKGRPGQVLEVLADPDQADHLAMFLLANTSTIGVRMSRVHRLMLPRETCTVETAFGNIAAKIVRLPAGRRRITPEYDACRARAQEHGVSVQEVYRAALKGTES